MTASAKGRARQDAEPAGSPAGGGGAAEESRRAGLERQSFVRHELRAPLAVLVPLLSLLLDEGAGPLTQQQREYLGMMERNVGRLNALVGSAAESGWLDCAAAPREPGAVRLAETAEDVVARLPHAARRQVPVRVVREGPSPVAWADPEQVRCIIRNLVDNALRYAGADVEVSLAAAGPSVVVEVRDGGRGMSAEDAAAAFEFGVRGAAAVQTGEPGMGIGLWVCRRLAEVNGGTVRLETAEGAGTTVSVTLPAAG